MEIPPNTLQRFQVQAKVQHEFQELCQELQPTYGKVIWSLPYKKGFTESKIREAAKIAKGRGKESIGYLIGIIKNLK